jgi:hypothetical protein
MVTKHLHAHCIVNSLHTYLVPAVSFCQLCYNKNLVEAFYLKPPVHSWNICGVCCKSWHNPTCNKEMSYMEENYLCRDCFLDFWNNNENNINNNNDDDNDDDDNNNNNNSSSNNNNDDCPSNVN